MVLVHWSIISYFDFYMNQENSPNVNEPQTAELRASRAQFELLRVVLADKRSEIWWHAAALRVGP